jgi:hypothetical protein
MKIQVEVTPAAKRSLSSQAHELGVSLEELARAAILDLAAKPGKDFQSAARYVLRKNKELYKRLAK